MGKMTRYSALGLAVILSFTIPAAHAFDFYVSGNAGIAKPEDSETRSSNLPGVAVNYGFDKDLTFAAALGLVEGPYRSEAEVSYQKNDLDSVNAVGLGTNPANAGLSGSAKAVSGLVNAYYDFDVGRGIHPYVTAGVGFSRIRARLVVEGFDNISHKYEDTVLGYQIGAGVGYALSRYLTLDLRYRFMTGQDPEFRTAAGTTTARFKSHNFTAGLRVRF
jgi:opacity protein-like surface antigen